MKKIFIMLGLMVILTLTPGCSSSDSSYSSQYSKLYDYPKQTQELCESGGATWHLFNTGCHDECVYARWTGPDRYACTESLTWGCQCGPGSCWDGTACTTD
jgi:hypothetical protein